jgi:hypothetical protein
MYLPTTPAAPGAASATLPATDADLVTGECGAIAPWATTQAGPFLITANLVSAASAALFVTNATVAAGAPAVANWKLSFVALYSTNTPFATAVAATLFTWPSVLRAMYEPGTSGAIDGAGMFLDADLLEMF